MKRHQNATLGAERGGFGIGFYTWKCIGLEEKGGVVVVVEEELEFVLYRKAWRALGEAKARPLMENIYKENAFGATFIN